MAKRIRASNFSEQEAILLVEIALKYKNVLENKETDGNTWKLKKETWTKVENEYNSTTNGIHRDSKSLRLKYDSLKRDVKMKNAKNKVERYKTSGGVPDIQKFKTHEEVLLSVLPAIDGLPYDNDSNGEITIAQILEVDTPVINNIEEATDVIIMQETSETNTTLKK